MKPKQIYKCQNCGKVFKADKVPVLTGRLEDRVAPGDVVPEGECDKCGAVVLAEPEVLRKPLAKAAIKKLAKVNNGWINGTVSVDLNDMIGRDLERFLDLISELLTGTDILEDIGYEIVGHTKDSVLLFVEGDASGILGTTPKRFWGKP